MILLDTNVVSALMVPDLNAPAIRWLDRQDPEAIWTSAISVYEVRAGIRLLPEGRRKAGLNDSLDRLLEGIFRLRIVPFDDAAAEHAAEHGIRQLRMGLTVEVQDIMIAGIVLARDARLATRNVRHFAGIREKLVNPWD